jgi:myosin heavy subunit
LGQVLWTNGGTWNEKNESTTALETKTLKEVNAAVKENYSEFKLAQSTWDKSTKTSEKLEARQKYLANQTSLYTQKVEQLTEELKQMEAAENQDTNAIEKKRAQLNSAQAKLNEYDKSLKQVTDDLRFHTTEMKEAATKVENFGNETTEVGKKASVVSGAVVGVGAAAIKTAADFESGMSKVAALSGATGSDLEKLKAKAREMGATTKYSASESAEALSYMALAGWDTNKMLAGIEPILNLAAASEMDLAEASDIVTDYMTAFGIEWERHPGNKSRAVLEGCGDKDTSSRNKWIDASRKIFERRHIV